MGPPQHEAAGLQPAVETIYDENGKAAVTYDAQRRATQMFYNARGKLSRTQYADSTSESTNYDAEGRRREIHTDERSMRPIALGRKSWLRFGSKAAGARIAAILSVIERCHRLKIPTREYLLDVLPRLANGNRFEVPSLTPQAWAAARLPKSRPVSSLLSHA